MGAFVRALVCMAMLLALLGCSTSRVLERGEAHLQNRQWDLAVAEFRQALEKEPSNPAYRLGLERAVLEATNSHHREGVAFIQEGNFDGAVGAFKKGLIVAPSHAGMQSAMRDVLAKKEARERTATGKSLADAGRLRDALREFYRAAQLDADHAESREMAQKVEKALASQAKEADPLSLASDKPITLNFKNTNIRDAFELLAKMAEINVLFDEEVRSQQVTIFAKDVTFKHALKLLLSTNKLTMKRVSRDTIIIIPRNRAKIEQYQDLQIRTFYLNSIAAKDMVNILRTMLETKKILINDKANAIILRESPEKLRLAEKIIEANDRQSAEIMLDVEILEVARRDKEKSGIKLGSTEPAAAAWIKDSVGTIGTSGIDLLSLKQLGPASFLFVLPSITLDLLKSDSNTKTLANPKLRVIEKKPAKILIGQRVPIQVSTTTTTAGTASGTTSSNFEYRDVGIKLNVEPEVHINHEVTLKLGLEVSTLGDLVDFGGGSKQYIFGTRNADTVVKLRDGETTIIGGLIQDDDRKSGNRIPGLSDAPLVGRLFAAKDNETVKSDILMSITPHLVRRMDLPPLDVQSFWSGTDDMYDTNPVFTFDEEEMPELEAAPATPSAAAAPAARAPVQPIPVLMPAPTLLPPPSDSAAPAAPAAPAIAPSLATPTPAASVAEPAVPPIAPAVQQDVVTPSSQPASQAPQASQAPVETTPAAEPKPVPAKDAQKRLAPVVPVVDAKPEAPAPPAPASTPTAPPAPVEPMLTKPKEVVPAAKPGSAPPAAAAQAKPSTPAVTPQAEPKEAPRPSGLTLPMVAMKPGESQVSPGSVVGLEVTVSDVKSLYAADLTITFDPEVVAFQNVMEGGFLKGDGRPTSFLFSVNNKTGKVDVSLSRVGMDTGVSGSGTLAFLVFQGKKEGASAVTVKVNKFQNADRGSLDHKATPATLTVK